MGSTEKGMVSMDKLRKRAAVTAPNWDVRWAGGGEEEEEEEEEEERDRRRMRTKQRMGAWTMVAKKYCQKEKG